MAQKVVHASKTVTTAGTRVQFSTSDLPVLSIYFEALDTNTGKIYIGTSTVSSSDYVAELDAKVGVSIEAGEMHGTLQEFILSDFWIDSSVNGEKVLVTYITRR